MAFVASPTAAPVTGPLPAVVDSAGLGSSIQLFSHIRIVGAGSVTFDTGQVCTGAASVDTVCAIPTGASRITVSGTPTLQYGSASGQ